MRKKVNSSGKNPKHTIWASMTHEEVEELVARRVAEEMGAREAAKNLETLNDNGVEQEGENGRNGNEGNEENVNGENGGNRNGGNGGNRNRGNRENGNHGINYGGFMPMARECTFQDFLMCKPHIFSGTEGVVGLTRWFKKMKTVFNISNSPPKYQVKYATCTLQDSALTWWNSHKRTICVDAAYAMKWAGLMKLITKVMFPEIGSSTLLDKLLLDFSSSAKFFSSGITLTQQWQLVFIGSGKLLCHWELLTGSGNALCILFPTILP
uniref:Reverse transcriptase domain-containing protein n=1 Tax=Tanacetum cinerariifolium TaxID=118510 RepID=A0A699IJZ8_TANCI|nr:hypothetical protein [Tanacetum cinerariifolium]